MSVRKRQKYTSKWCTSPQNCKDFPPKAKFPGNEIPKFLLFSMNAQYRLLVQNCECEMTRAEQQPLVTAIHIQVLFQSTDRKLFSFRLQRLGLYYAIIMLTQQVLKEIRVCVSYLKYDLNTFDCQSSHIARYHFQISPSQYKQYIPILCPSLVIDKRRYQVYPTMHYSHQGHLLKCIQTFLLWIVGLEKINQPIDSALNNTQSPKHALYKQCGGNLLNGQNQMGPLIS